MFLLSFILGVCLTKLAQSGPAPQPFLEDSDVYYPSLNWSHTFDWKLLKEYSPLHSNLIISPISLKIILSLLYQGSAGVTQRELENVLEFKDKESAKEEFRTVLSLLQVTESAEYLLNLGTRVFLDYHQQPQQKFASIARDYYKTDIALTNFSNTIEAGTTINSWAEKLTNGRIPKLINPGDLEDAIMVIANAIYFKGSWLYPFSNKTKDEKFYVPNGDNFFAINTEFMSLEDKFYYHESIKLDAKILRLPYRGGRYSMFIILPNSRAGLTSLVRQINYNTIKNMLFFMEKRQVTVKLPKFKFDFQARFSKTLQEFGLLQMFQNTASFPGIARGNSTILRKLVVSDIVQKAGIEVNQFGSIVYAASELTIGNKFGEQMATFEATHPFLFYIEEEANGIILFVGQVENPLGGEILPLEAKPEA